MKTHRGLVCILGIVVALFLGGCPESVLGTWDSESVVSDTGETTATVWSFYAGTRCWIGYESGAYLDLHFKQSGDKVNVQGTDFFSDLDMMQHVDPADAEFTCSTLANFTMTDSENMTGECWRTIHNSDNSINETVHTTETAHRRGLFPS